MAQVRRSLWFVLLLGVMAILFTITILVAWSIIFTEFYSVASGPGRYDLGVGYWMILSIGCVFLIVIVAAIVISLVANIRAASTVQRQNAFIDSVTHELKSPLASIRLAVETLERRELTPEMKRRFMSIIKADLDRLTAFIEHILEAGRLEHAGGDVKFEPTEVATITLQVAERLRERYRLETGALAVAVDPELADRLVLVDTVAYETIVANLLDNAVKYSDDDIHVTVSLSARDSQLELVVQDRGLGIPRGALKRVFDRFYRVERRYRKAVRGTGLGLYVTQLLCRAMGGRVALASDGEHKGTRALVTLPLRWADAAPETGHNDDRGTTETAPARG